MKHLPATYQETLTEEELIFLKRKESGDKKQLMLVLRVILILCFLIPFLFSWWMAAEGAPDPFSYLSYFLGVLFLICFSCIPLWAVYNGGLRKIQRDIARGIKTVEQSRITRKTHMAVNNSFHLYLSSSIKLSIEVSDTDYHRLKEGDEVNIEYTPLSKLYLGYF